MIFEVIRSQKEGGSLLTGVHENLSPVLIYENDILDILVVQIKIGNQIIRLINAYGPQEYDSQDKIIEFYSIIDQEVQNAKEEGCQILMELDANAKIGWQCYDKDPHLQSQNGKILVDLVERNNLIICNVTSKCQGTITRKRKTKSGLEESILDFMILSDELYQYL